MSATAATAGPTIRATGLGRRFGEAWAVRNLSFDVAPGEVLGLLGPNGAGKTTTVRMLTALIAATEGSASIDGRDVRRDAEDVRRRVGVLTETPGLYEKLSARANLAFFGRLHRLPSDVADERIRRLLTLFDLWDRRDEPAGTFSKGMKQKLAIARALLHEPAVLFLDEPTAALDPEAAFIVRDAISRLRAAGRTIVLATHNLDEAGRLCDRIAFIRGGLLRIDSPARLRDEAGRGRVSVLFAARADGLAEAALGVAGVRAATASDGRLDVDVDDPEQVTPALVRTLVGAGAAILEVRRQAATLEDVYFEVMGVRPGAGGELD
ncbi:MAG TPA: ABC transporter ATP-binding protein [Candidatus Limnocylindrales bacterium]|nr:ABC transporter ATP-binding protein [Candidatus Limnocylindrales bacterium]